MDTVFATFAAGAVGFLLWMRFRPSLSREIRRACASRELSGLIDFVNGKPNEAARATAFNMATRTLWDQYERKLAAGLIRGLGAGLSSTNIAQYWMKQTLEVEPEIAGETFDEEFLREYYNPEHAARCGKFG